MSKSEQRNGAESRERRRSRVWLVLARKAYEEPLRQVGAVEAEDSELASVYARSIYDEFAWIEMTVVPRDEMVTVIHS